jgi:hypothetical protein
MNLYRSEKPDAPLDDRENLPVRKRSKPSVPIGLYTDSEGHDKFAGFVKLLRYFAAREPNRGKRRLMLQAAKYVDELWAEVLEVNYDKFRLFDGMMKQKGLLPEPPKGRKDEDS